MSAKNKQGGQEGALVMLLDRQRVQKASSEGAESSSGCGKETGGSRGDSEGGGSTGSARRSTGQSGRLDRRGGLVRQGRSQAGANSTAKQKDPVRVSAGAPEP